MASLKHPFNVISNFLEPAWSLCSHNHTPCHVPRFNLPSVIGIVSDEPRKHAFTCAGLKTKRNNSVNLHQIAKIPCKYSLDFYVFGCGIEIGGLTMSSGPSHECLYCKPSGTILFNIISISSRTSGSQLSFNAKLALVCNTEIIIKIIQLCVCCDILTYFGHDTVPLQTVIIPALVSEFLQ